jgi:tRNA U34 5-methylaminomethyl-2-thiouridine-forming methyltransferase MnmC
MKDQYEYKKTADGSLTLFNHQYNDTMHSDRGAFREALYTHVIPSRIFDTIPEESWTLYDIGFGLGYNSIAAIAEWYDRGAPFPLSIYAFEKDTSLRTIISRFPYEAISPKAVTPILVAVKEGKYSDSLGLSITLHFGDARTLLDNDYPPADAVFHDAYTPSKNPELWTLHFFSKIKKLMAPHGLMTTYSRAPQIRGALLEAGMHIGSNKYDETFKEGTVASPSAFEGEFNEKEIKEIQNNIKSTPYHDDRGTMAGEDILEQRKSLMKEKRSK